MKFNQNIKSFILNVKNSLTYLLIIAVYFFFVNLEVNKQEKNRNTSVQSEDSSIHNTNIINSSNSLERYENNNEEIHDELKISIPIIPYRE